MPFLSPLIQDLLKKAGWYAGRRVEIASHLIEFQNQGWEIHPKVLDYLIEFQDLEFTRDTNLDYRKTTSDYVSFDFTMFDPSSVEYIKDWAKKHIPTLFPFGVHHQCELFITENGTLYESDGEEMIWKCGENFNNSLENLFFDRKYFDIKSISSA
jgi:hypothetical protein